MRRQSGLRGQALARVVASLFLIAPACGDSVGASGSGSDPRRVDVVTTVAPLTSIVSAVVGSAADLAGIVPEGTNSHTFEPAPAVAKVLHDADVIFVNGLKLEEPTVKLAERNKRESARIVKLGEEVLPESEYVYDFSFPKSGGKPNPHLWTDPTYAKRYAEVVRDTMIDVDPRNREEYAANFETFAGRVGELDHALRAASATIPIEQRKLLTYHDAYAYFARTYGWRVIGAIQVDSFSDPSPREVASLIAQVRTERVPAIFGSEVFPSPVLAQIGKEAGVKYVDVLRDDDLPGKPGEASHSWLGLMRFDYATMVEALGGDASAIRAVALDTVTDHARYPQ